MEESSVVKSGDVNIQIKGFMKTSTHTRFCVLHRRTVGAHPFIEIYESKEAFTNLKTKQKKCDIKKIELHHVKSIRGSSNITSKGKENVIDIRCKHAKQILLFDNDRDFNDWTAKLNSVLTRLPSSSFYEEPDIYFTTPPKTPDVIPENLYDEAISIPSNNSSTPSEPFEYAQPFSRKGGVPISVPETLVYADATDIRQNAWKSHGRTENEEHHEENYLSIKDARKEMASNGGPPPIPLKQYEPEDDDDTYNTLETNKPFKTAQTASQNIYGLASAKEVGLLPHQVLVPEADYNKSDSEGEPYSEPEGDGLYDDPMADRYQAPADLKLSRISGKGDSYISKPASTPVISKKPAPPQESLYEDITDSYMLSLDNDDDGDETSTINQMYETSKKELIDTSEFGNIDQRYVTAYIDALKEGEEITNTIRVNVVGNAGVGKSTLTRNLLGMGPNHIIESTDGIDVHVHKCCENGDWSSKSVPSDERTAERIAMSCLDMQSTIQEQEHPKELTDIEVQKLVKHDVRTETNTIGENLQDDEQSGVYLSLPTSDPITSGEDNDTNNGKIITPHQTNVQLELDVSSDENEKKLIRNFSLKLEEKDSSSQKLIQIWDFGGQFIYYATHQLFHSRRAVYLLVLNASNDLNETVEKCEFTNSDDKDVQHFCKFWMHSIDSFVGNDRDEPPVILVATHVDKIPDWNMENRDDFFDSIRNLFDETTVGNHIQPESFAVNNNSENSSDVEALRKYIVEVAQRQESWNARVPTKWIPLEDKVMKRKPDKQVTLQVVKEMATDLNVPITDEVQVKAFLTYHHALGNLVYFDNEGLSEIVVVDPQWIIDAFKAIITAKAYCQNRGPLRKRWKQLTEEGILSNELLKEVWGLDNQYWKDKDILLKFLIKLGIISAVTEIDIDRNTEQPKEYFLVPSLLSAKSHELCLQQLFKSRNGTQTTLVFAFEDNIIPPTLHHRLTAAALGKWKVIVFRDQRMLSNCLGVYELDNVHAGVIKVCETSIEIRVVNLCGKDIPVSPTQIDRFRRFVRLKIESELNRFSERETSPYNLCIRCNFNNKKGKQILALSNIENSEYVPCPDKHPEHTIRIVDIKREWFCERGDNSADKKEMIKMLWEDSKRDLTLPVTERELSGFAYALGFNWELLGIELGLSKANIEQIIMDNPYKTKTQIFIMLKTWMEKEGEKSSMENLLKSTVGIVGMTVDWDKIKKGLD